MTATLGEQLDQYFELTTAVHEAFGYTEDWVVIPLDDEREVYWHLSGEGYGDSVTWSDTPENLRRYLGLIDGDEPADENRIWSCQIYTQRFLPKWVYRAEDFTMVCVDTQTDGNKFLMVFSNAREVTT